MKNPLLNVLGFPCYLKYRKVRKIYSIFYIVLVSHKLPAIWYNSEDIRDHMIDPTFPKLKLLM